MKRTKDITKEYLINFLIDNEISKIKLMEYSNEVYSSKHYIEFLEFLKLNVTEIKSRIGKGGTGNSTSFHQRWYLQAEEKYGIDMKFHQYENWCAEIKVPIGNIFKPDSFRKFKSNRKKLAAD